MLNKKHTFALNFNEISNLMRKYVLFVFLLTTLRGYSQDRVFAHTYQSNILPYSVAELEYLTTLRSGKDNFYNAIDQRLEMEYGLGKSVQTALYMNLSN